MKLGPKSKKLLKEFKAGFEATKQGYGKTVGFVDKYAPMASNRLGRAAGVAVNAFQPTKFNTESEFVQLPMRRQVRMPPARERRHNFGTLSFDI